MIKSILLTRHSRTVMLWFIPVIASTVAVFMCDISNIRWLRMIWNYFLAVIPVYMALSAESFYSRKQKTGLVISSLLWLLFFPNSVYMLTDFKYLSMYKFSLWSSCGAVGENLAPWILLVNLIISITAGVLAGLMSLNIMHGLLGRVLSPKACWGAISAIAVLSSFGVYIGRFARLNSWDIIMPAKLFSETMRVMTPFAAVFILMFTVLTLVLYAGFYLITGRLCAER